ncbi:uncharacterized protein LOC126991895 [Eriocheir sinensis]|uniref:uncharacterized protein LOC126991895 n=1 Tax=Eriocheir sinensis TaxID=95602 RepID=UPI0021CABB67|nr:uncharacterized protein LOC126991895 [Eriocheir sinensis]
MLKHVGQYRSTTSLARAPCPAAPAARPRDPSPSCRATGGGDEDSASSPEVLRRSLSLPGSYSDSSSPECPKRVLGRVEVQKEGLRQVEEQKKGVREVEDQKKGVREVEDQKKGVREVEDQKKGVREVEDQKKGVREVEDQKKGVREVEDQKKGLKQVEEPKRVLGHADDPKKVLTEAEDLKDIKPGGKASSEVPNNILQQVEDPKKVLEATKEASVGSLESMTVPEAEDSQDEDSSSPEVQKKGMARPSTLPRRASPRPPQDPPLTAQPTRKGLRSSESCSLSSSSASFLSLAPSRSSSTSSLADQTMTPVKVYLRFMRPDMEYKTLSLSSGATCRQLVLMLLAKFRLRHRDPNLFFVTMEVTVRVPGGGAPARRLLVLDDQARPAELQQCRPRGEARFSVGVRRGGLVRVHDGILMPGSQYKSLLVSYRTTAEELVQLMLNCYNSKESPARYAVHEVCEKPYSDRPLRRDEYPLLVQSEWPRALRPRLSLVLRRTAAYGIGLQPRTSWRHSLGHSDHSTDTDSEQEDPAPRGPCPASCPAPRPALPRACSNDSLLSSDAGDTAPSPSSPTSSSSSSSRVSCDSGFFSPSSSSVASSDSPSPPPSPSPSSLSSSSTFTCTSLHQEEEERPPTPSPTLYSSSSSLPHTPSPEDTVASSSSLLHIPPPPSSSITTCSASHTPSSPVFSMCHLHSSTSSPSSPVPPPRIRHLPPPSSISFPSSPVPPPRSKHSSLRSSTRSIPPYFLSSLYPSSYSSSSSSSSIQSIPPPSTVNSSFTPTSIITSSSSSTSSSTSSLHSIPPPSTVTSSFTPTTITSSSSSTSSPSRPPSPPPDLTHDSASESIKQLTAALESLRSLTIRCPDYNCLYI